LDRKGKRDRGKNITLSNTVGGGNSVIWLAFTSIYDQVRLIVISPMKEVEDWGQLFLGEDSGCDGGATSVLKGRAKVSGDKNGVMIELKRCPSKMNASIDAGGFKSVLYGREKVGEFTGVE
jgi:hypothetical protein